MRLLLCLLSTLSSAAALTSAEATWWANYAQNLPHAKANAPPPGNERVAVPKEAAPVFLRPDWWEGEHITLGEEAMEAMATGKAGDVFSDACASGWTDDCEVPNMQTELLLDAECSDAVGEESEECALVEPNYSDVLSKSLPCVTTEDGCELEAGAAIEPPAVFELGSLAPELTYAHPCWWDEGCETFAS